MTATETATEPICCDEPMIYNSFTGQYECAEAYLRLLDDGVLGGVPELSDTDAMNDYQRERFEHWKTTRIPAAEAQDEPPAVQINWGVSLEWPPCKTRPCTVDWHKHADKP